MGGEGFAPLDSGKLGFFGNPLRIGEDAGGLQEGPSGGELISGAYSTYHGPIDLMVPQLSQDLDKSLDSLSDLSVGAAKVFRSPSDPEKSVVAFLGANAQNISFVIEQQDLCDNVIGFTVLQELGFKKPAAGGPDSSAIQDFTLVDFRYLLVLMPQGNIVVFDSYLVLTGGARQVRFLNKY